jgi:membrane peptidoglycan carboxypeptidase
VVFDVQTQFQTTCDPEGRPLSSATSADECYMPSNYDDKFRGPITLRNALAQSLNIPAIKVLYLAGIKNSLTTASHMGITSLGSPDTYGLTLVLGGGEVSLLEETSAYSVFANDGLRNPYNSILKVEDKDGNVLEEYHPSSEQVIPQNTARQITSILSDNVARTPEFGTDSPLYFPGRDVAAKTGTTNDYRDAWIIGYTPNFALGAWAGNNDNTPMEKRIAGYVVAPMWNAFMQVVLAEEPAESFTPPTEPDPSTLKPVMRGIWRGGVTYYTDKISGKLATEYTPPELRDEHVVNNIHNILYWVDRKSPLGPSPTHPETDPQFNLWEYGVRKWVAANNISEVNTPPPTMYDDVHTPEKNPQATITTPNAKGVFDSKTRILITLETHTMSTYPIKHVDFFIDDNLLGSSDKPPFNFSFIPNDYSVGSGPHTLKVVVYDSALNRTTATQQFNVQ